MKRFGLLVLTLVSLTEISLAQKTETTAIPFLLISPDSRSSGYGEGGVAMAGVDPNTIFWNPAALHKIKNIQVAITHANWLPQFQTDLFYDYIAATYPLDDDWGTLAGHFTFLNLGENVYTDDQNNNLGTFRSYDFALGVSYGVPLDEEWSFGTGVRLIYSRLAPNNVKVGNENGNGSSFGIGFDLATEYQPDYFDRLIRVGASITNIGPKVSYVDDTQADPMPTKFRLGTSYRIVNDEYYTTDIYVEMSKLLIVSDVVDTVNEANSKRYKWYEGLYKSWTKDGFTTELTKSNLALGGEFTYEKYVSLRMGYFYENKDYGDRQFITYGAGIVYDFLKVDFSYISAFKENHPLAGTIRISLGLDVTLLNQ